MKFGSIFFANCDCWGWLVGCNSVLIQNRRTLMYTWKFIVHFGLNSYLCLLVCMTLLVYGNDSEEGVFISDIIRYFTKIPAEGSRNCKNTLLENNVCAGPWQFNKTKQHTHFTKKEIEQIVCMEQTNMLWIDARDQKLYNWTNIPKNCINARFWYSKIVQALVSLFPSLHHQPLQQPTHWADCKW